MPQPVWVLSVDLQTKTATFQSGMASAAKSARSAFQDIRSSAGEMSEGASRGFGDIRHSLGLLDNSIRGAHGAAMADAIRLTAQYIDISSALPFAAMAGGFLLVGGGIVALANHIKALREEQEHLKDSDLQFGTAINNTFNALDEKLLQAGIKADELNKDHLGALHLQLQLIDRQSMAELVHSFGEIGKAADAAFAELKGSWYTFGIGSAGAQHALTEFKVQYDALLAAGKDKEAADLLKGTRESAEHILAMQQQANSSQAKVGLHGTTQQGDYAKFEAARNELKKAGVGFTEKEVHAQQALVQALAAQAEVQQKVNALKGVEGSNAAHETSDKFAQEADEARRQRLESLKIGQQQELKAWEEAHARAVAELQDSEKAKIEATEQGSAARLAAIADALKKEEMYGLQETSFYRELSNSQIQTARQMADEEQRQKEEAGKEAAAHDSRMGELAVAAERELGQARTVQALMSGRDKLQAALELANEEYTIQQDALASQLVALDQNGKDYENKKKTLNNKLEELEREHANKIQQIQNQAASQQLSALNSAETRMVQEYARGFSEVIMGKESMGRMMAQIDSQIAAAMLQNAITDIATLNMDREKTAAKAARTAYMWGWSHGGPAAPVLAPALGAMAFAAEMAFASGGIVPGTGRGDIVPAMLEPGEAVLPKKLTDMLTNTARSGNPGGGGHTYHVHYRPSISVQAIDRSGVQEMLEKHESDFQSHTERMLRKMNR